MRVLLEERERGDAVTVQFRADLLWRHRSMSGEEDAQHRPTEGDSGDREEFHATTGYSESAVPEFTLRLSERSELGLEAQPVVGPADPHTRTICDALHVA